MSISMIVLSVMFVVFLFFLYMAKSAITKTPTVVDHEDIITLTEQNFHEQTKGKTILVDFWAEWCAPCRMMAPILNELSEDIVDPQFIGKINIENQPNLAKRFNVRGIPTFIILQNGVEVKRIVGVKTKAYLAKELKLIESVNL